MIRIKKSGHRIIESSGDLKSKAFDLRSPNDPITRSPDPKAFDLRSPDDPITDPGVHP